MTPSTIALMKRGVLGLAAGAFSLGLAAIPAHAQDDGRYYDNGYSSPASDDDDTYGVTVTAPHRWDDVDHVSASRTVRYGDLDINTDYGAHILKARIERAARSACRELDRDYPDASDAPGRGCYDDAVRHGLQDASYQIGYRPSDW